jgi:hypothetical protein
MGAVIIILSIGSLHGRRVFDIQNIIRAEAFVLGGEGH